MWFQLIHGRGWLGFSDEQRRVGEQVYLVGWEELERKLCYRQLSEGGMESSSMIISSAIYHAVLEYENKVGVSAAKQHR